jgi:diguanylate cyclase (GGDEF)-like protein
VGDVLYAVASAGDGYPVPSIADAFWLGAYPLLAAGVVVLGRPHGTRVAPGVAVDAVLGACTAAALVAAVTVERAATAARGMPLDAYLVSVAYPIADAVLLAVALAAVGIAGWRRSSGLWSPVAAFGLWIVADVVYCTPLADVPSLGRAADASLLTGAVLLAVAAQGGRARVVAAPRSELAAAPLAFAAGALMLLAVGAVIEVGPVAALLAVAALALALLRLAIALRENARLLRLSRLDATTDALTGLGNRRALFARSAEGLAGLLVVIDLNGFKDVNDALGHVAGDAVLRDVAERLAGVVGASGSVYRLGGDEFCAVVRAEAVPPHVLDDLVRATTFVTAGQRLTAAVGAVSLPSEAASVEGALAIADERMYAHKRGESSALRASA